MRIIPHIPTLTYNAALFMFDPHCQINRVVYILNLSLNGNKLTALVYSLMILWMLCILFTQVDWLIRAHYAYKKKP